MIYDFNKEKCFKHLKSAKKGIGHPYDSSLPPYEFIENLSFCEKGFKMHNFTCIRNSLDFNFEMKYVFTYYLHGIRTPLSLVNQTDIIGQKWERADTLSKIGMRQDYLSGHYFKDKYMYQTKLINNYYDTKEIRVESVNNEASLLSAYSFLKGLFSEKKDITLKSKKSSNNISNLISSKKRKNFRFKSIFKINKAELGNNSRENLYKNKDSLNIRFNSTIYEKQTQMDRFSLPFGFITIPVHSYENYSKEYGIDKLSSCKGAISNIENSYHHHKDIFMESYLHKFIKNGNLLNLLQLPEDTKLDVFALYNITDAFYSNIQRNNINITNLNISKDILEMFYEFKDKLAYNILYKNEYLTKIVTANSMHKIVNHVERIVEIEKEEIEDNTKSYFEKIQSMNEKLSDLTKFDIYFPGEEVYWGIMTYISKLVNIKVKIPLFSSSVSIELVKNMTGYSNILFQKDKISKTEELSNLFQEYYGNYERYIINVFHNDKKLASISFNTFKQNISKNLLKIKVVEAYCNPKELGNSSIIIMMLIAFVTFELLLLACFYAIKQ